MLIVSLSCFSQPLLAQTVESKQAEMREKIGLDLTVPDFDTKKIDAKIMGPRLQGVYDRRLCSIASEQNEALENAYFQIKKMKSLNSVKKGNEIAILMRADLQKNAANVKQTDIAFHFVDGLSESEKVNVMFSYISHYVQAREQLE